MAREASQPRPPERFWRLLKQGDSWNEYHGDPVRLVGAVVGLAVDHGVSLSWLLRLLDNPANAAAEPVRSGRVKLATIRRWYERSGSTQQREWCRDAWRQQLLELQQLATSSAWPAWIDYAAREDAPPVRVKGSDARRVLAAHVQLAIASNGIDYPASRRKVAELSNVGDASSQRATAVLVALGILRRRRAPGRVGPFSALNYRIEASGEALCKILAGDGDDELADLAALECHPLWRHGSGVRFDVWAHVVAGDGAATTASIATAANAQPATVRRTVANLVRLELVERTDDGTLRALTTDRAALDEAAEACGMADRSRRQVERHEADREAHVQHVLRSPRMFVEAMRRRVRAVVAAVEARLVVNRQTGEVITVSIEREAPPTEFVAGGDRQHAPPSPAVRTVVLA